MGVIVIIPTTISTLHLYLLSHWFYCHNSDRNIYITSLPIISSVLSSRITSYLIRAIIFPYYVSCRIVTFLIDVIILYHMPYQILITCTYSSIIIIKCRYHMTFRRKPLEFTPVFLWGSCCPILSFLCNVL